MAGVFLCGGVLFGLIALASVGCGDRHSAVSGPNPPPDTLVEPAHVVVQHLLVGFQGSVPGKPITRTRGEAQKIAETLYADARNGADFDTMVQSNTDDAWPGIYGMSNLGVPPDRTADPPEYPRSGMIPAFGNVGFRLAVGEYGLAPYDPARSPYGWHIIKRLR